MKSIKNLLIILVMTALIATGCQGNRAYRKKDGGVQVFIGTNILSIQPWTEKIMRVTYAASDSLLNRQSLIVKGESRKQVKSKITVEEDVLTLSTSEMLAKVNLKTGELGFYDKTGQPFLLEKKGGAKTLEQANILASTTWHVGEQFENTDGEALYGLGQHQDRLMNIKGYDIELFQRNREVFVPFLVSTKNYGILWDNYSYTRFGSMDSTASIPSEYLRNRKGEKGGLSASFYSDTYMKQRISLPAFNDSYLPCILPAGIKNKVMSAVWEGTLEAPESGEFQFFCTGQQYFKLFINNVQVRNYWSSFLMATDVVRMNLEAGKQYKIRIEYAKSLPTEKMAFTWRKPSEKLPVTALWSEAGKALDYYVVKGNSMDEVISGYRQLSGTAAMLPKWGYGFWQCRERYKTADEITGIVKEFRDRKIPMDVIVQDWQYWLPGDWGTHEFDPSRFPDPGGMIDTIHSMNAHIMISVWAKFYTNNKNFKELNQAGYIYPYNVKDKTPDWLGNVQAYYDAFNPGARKMYWDQMNRELYSKGIDAWWLDATEPEIQQNITPQEMALRMNPTFLGSGAEYLNAYPTESCRGVYEGQRSVDPDKRVSILTRSAFAGQQQYGAVTWSGDIVGRWEVLKAQIPAALNFCLSGIPYWTCDIGGFNMDYPGGNQNEEYRELFTRWFQFGAFCPVFRVHGSNTPREIWFFGGEKHPAYQTQLKFINLRYRLLPYIYSLAGKTTLEGYTPMRALAMDFPNDPAVFNIADQYLYGPSLMINPVTDFKARERTVYLPPNGWYDFWTGKFTEGGKVITAAAPYESMPIFVKAGSIIPVGRSLQFAMEKQADTLDIMVYTGIDAAFTLYDDEGVTYGYEKGIYQQIPMSWNEASKTLTIGDSKGTYPGMPVNRLFRIYVVSPTSEVGYDAPGKPMEQVLYTGRKTELVLK